MLFTIFNGRRVGYTLQQVAAWHGISISCLKGVKGKKDDEDRRKMMIADFVAHEFGPKYVPPPCSICTNPIVNSDWYPWCQKCGEIKQKEYDEEERKIREKFEAEEAEKELKEWEATHCRFCGNLVPRYGNCNGCCPGSKEYYKTTSDITFYKGFVEGLRFFPKFGGMDIVDLSPSEIIDQRIKEIKRILDFHHSQWDLRLNRPHTIRLPQIPVFPQIK